jgi:TusA-related sulfurtransferase
MKEIDARGLACPGPVLQTKAALQERVGEATNMLDIVTAMQLADSVINI